MTHHPPMRNQASEPARKRPVMRVKKSEISSRANCDLSSLWMMSVRRAMGAGKRNAISASVNAIAARGETTKSGRWGHSVHLILLIITACPRRSMRGARTLSFTMPPRGLAW